MYPLTVAPPRTKAEYAGKLRFAHEHGFNFVRHHSHTLPGEYFDAADEAGVMVSPELPCAYGSYFAAANATGQELYLASWASYVAALRNHPSILVWTLCNEMYMGAAFTKDGVTFGAERFHAVVQALDPARLMNDQDGACGARGRERQKNKTWCGSSPWLCSPIFESTVHSVYRGPAWGCIVRADEPTKAN